MRESVGRARDEDSSLEPGTLHIYAKVKGATTTIRVPLLGSLVCRMCNPKNLCTLCSAPCGDDAALRLLVSSDCEKSAVVVKIVRSVSQEGARPQTDATEMVQDALFEEITSPERDADESTHLQWPRCYSPMNAPLVILYRSGSRNYRTNAI